MHRSLRYFTWKFVITIAVFGILVPQPQLQEKLVLRLELTCSIFNHNNTQQTFRKCYAFSRWTGDRRTGRLTADQAWMSTSHCHVVKFCHIGRTVPQRPYSKHALIVVFAVAGVGKHYFGFDRVAVLGPIAWVYSRRRQARCKHQITRRNFPTMTSQRGYKNLHLLLDVIAA